MNKLYKLPKETLKLLHKHGLFQQFVKAEITYDLLSKISINEELRQKAIQEFLMQKGLNTETLYEKWLIENHHTKKEAEDLATLYPRFKKYSVDTFGHKAGARFLERKSQLDIVVYSLIRVSDYGLAQELFLRIQEKEAELGDIASQYSEGIEKNTRGLIGPTQLANAHPKLAEVLRSIPTGKLQPPQRMLGSFVILRLESYEPVKLDEFMKEKMSEELSHEYIDGICIKLSRELLTQSNESCEDGEI